MRRGAPLGRIVVGESGKDEIGLHRAEKEDGGDHEEAIAHRRIDTKVKASWRVSVCVAMVRGARLCSS